jgi:Adenylate and Guanylate cyclase catalytic domain
VRVTYRRTWTWEFDVPRERLWRFVADTDWVNEHAGLPPIEARFEPLPEGGARRIGRFTKGPFVVEWEERPALWEAPEFFVIERLYRRGPLARFWTRNAFEAIAGGTRVTVEVALDPASPAMRLRAGFHIGPCIAMRANDRIDYFGTTVNLAARLQKLAGPGEVTLARSVAAMPAIADLVARLNVSAAETLELKGFPQRIDVLRVAARL